MSKFLHLAAATAVVATTLTIHAPSAYAGGGFAPPGIQPCFNPGGCNPPAPGGLLPPPPGGGGGGGGGGGNGGLGGFGAGLVGGMIGGALINGMNQPQTVVVQQPPVMVQPVPQPMPQPVPQPGMVSEAHVQYCLTKYKSYKIPTNTYTAYSGQQKPCISPYM